MQQLMFIIIMTLHDPENRFLYSSLMHNILSKVSPSSTLPSAPHNFSPPDPPIFCLSSKKSRTPKDTKDINQTQHNKMHYDLTYTVISRQDKATQQEKKRPKAEKKVRASLLFHGMQSYKNTKLHSDNEYEEDLAGPVISASVFVSPCEHCLVICFCGQCSHGVRDLSGSYTPILLNNFLNAFHFVYVWRGVRVHPEIACILRLEQ